MKSLSDSSARKLTYNLEEVARALYMKFSTGVAWEKIPLCRKYKRSTAYQYWWKKLKESGRFEEIKGIMEDSEEKKEKDKIWTTKVLKYIAENNLSAEEVKVLFPELNSSAFT